MKLSPSLRAAGVALFASAALLVAALSLPGLRAQRPSSVDALLSTPPLPAEVMRVLSLGFESALADLSYLQAIQLYGERSYDRSEELRIVRGRAIARLLEHVTDLDPRFAYAYVFGAMTIPVPSLDKRIHNVDATISLLRKSLRSPSDDWRLPFHLAYQHTSIGEFAEAAPHMAEAARRPGRPDYVPFLATRLAAQGDALDTGLDFARAMLDQAEDPRQVEELIARIKLLEMERHLREIERAATAYLSEQGQLPPSVEALLASGHLGARPEEPHGGAYLIDPETGEARSTAAQRLRVSSHYLEELRLSRQASADAESSEVIP